MVYERQYYASHYHNIPYRHTQRHTCLNTIENNLKKSRRASYVLMHTGLHGENGLDPTTSINLLRTFLFPIMLYGLETLLPSGKNLELLNKHHRTIIKLVLSLPTNVANQSIYILSELLPVEAEIPKYKALTLFGIICRSTQESVEWRVAERQLALKNMKSHSWFVDIKKLFIKYDLGNPYEYLLCSDYSRLKWKNMINKTVNIYWFERISFEAKLFKSLQDLGSLFRIGQCHPIAKTCTASTRDISRIPVRLKIARGLYIRPIKRAVFNKDNGNATCKLCKKMRKHLIILFVHATNLILLENHY